MAINIPQSRQEVVDRAKTDVQNELEGSQTFLKASFIGATITGYAGRIYDVYLQLKVLMDQLFPNTATMIEFITVWATYVNLLRKAASFAEGTNCLTITGVIGTVIPQNTQWTANSLTYFSQADVTLNTISINVTLSLLGTLVTATSTSNHNLANGQSITISGATPSDYNGTFTITVLSETQFTYSINTMPSSATGTISASFVGALASIKCNSSGMAGNLDNGVQMTILVPLDNVDNIAVVNVNEVAGGFDIETPQNYKKRSDFRYKNLHAPFNRNMIITRAMEIQGITRVWVMRATPSPGFATVYIVDDNSTPIIPPPSVVSQVFNHIFEIAPLDIKENQLKVFAPTAVPVNFNFASITPDTAQMREAIDASLNGLFRGRNEVGQNMQKQVYAGAIGNTVDSAGVQLQRFTLNSPTADILIGLGQIATFGSSNL